MQQNKLMHVREEQIVRDYRVLITIDFYLFLTGPLIDAH